MKKMLKKIGFLSIVAGALFSCSDFEEMNVNPTAASVDQVQVEYFINNSIIGAQQDPNIAERVFVLYWKDAGRMDRIGSLSEGYYSEDWSSQYYTYVSRWLKDINTAVRVADEQIESGNSKVYTNNLKQIARIWRAYLMSEMADNFGPMPIDGFQGVNPDYNSVKDVYYFILDELKDASNSLELDVNNPDNLKNGDPAYGYDYTQWKQYANSLRMRFAMRISEVDPAKAKTEFEDAVSGGVYVATLDDNFAVQEKGGWDALTGVMSREWNSQYLSATSNNLMIGLGGVTSEAMLSADKHAHIKPANYMGLKYDDHFTTLTNDPSAGFWFDGLHNAIDPRAYDAYPIPGDFDNPEFNKYPSWASNATTTKRLLLDDAGNDLQEIDAAFTWNAPATGDWGEKGSKNRLYWYQGTLPRLASKYRNSSMKRVFFGSWESYFLIAEASVKGWNVPMSGKSAYEAGIEQSFTYNNVSGYIGDYLTSQNYNRVGTSVSWDHTTEPPATIEMDYVDGYTGTPGTFNFKYPSNTIYQGGAVKNDLLTKIITQKFIAQTPWLPLETWNDHRRLGLPFFENPAIENLLTDSPNLTLGNYMENSVKVFPQRLKYPSGIANNVPLGYQQAVEFLEGPDAVFTPLWWAKKQ